MTTRYFLFFHRGCLALTLLALSMASCTKVKPSIYKKWMMGEGEELHMVDMVDHVHFSEAVTYSKDYCKAVHDSYTPGEFYLLKQWTCKVKMQGDDAGEVLGRHNGRDTVLCSFKDLTHESVTFVFPGKGEMKATTTQRKIQVVNVNSEQINIGDLINVYENYLQHPSLLEEICKVQGLTLVSKKKARTLDDYSHELWGRGVCLKAWLICSKMEEGALALGYLYKRSSARGDIEYAETALSFSEPRLLEVYERQMARLGYFPKEEIQSEESYEIVFAPDGWVESSGQPVFTLVDDKSGIYYLSYGE